MTATQHSTPPGPVVVPRVAVVVPAFDAERYLAETLESVRQQTFPGWECVVVDDGSSDGTAAVAEGFCARDPRFRLVRQPNAGVSAARNTGLDAVSDDVTLLAFLDSDDVWLPDTLAVLVAAVEEADAGTVGVYGFAEYMDADGHPVRQGLHPAGQADRRRLGRLDLTRVPDDEPSTWSSLVVSGTIWPSGVALHRRSAVERAGRFDVEQRYMEDWDLYLRMSGSGVFRPVPRQVVRYRRHGANLTAHAEQMAFHGARLRWKTTTSTASSPGRRREARRVWRRLQLRWVCWAGLAAVRAVRAGDRELAADAVHATRVFARQLAHGAPEAPDHESARLIARFVTPRAHGAGAAVDG